MKKVNLFALALGAALLGGVAMAQQALPPVGEGSQRVADAKPGDVRLVITDGFRNPFERVRPQLEKIAGHPLVVQYSESHILQKEIEAGQPFEVALVTKDVIDSGVAKGIMQPSPALVGRIRVGIFQRGDAPKVDVSTPDALKKAFMGAKSIRWSSNAAAEPTVFNVFNKLGVNESLKPKFNPTVMGQPNTPATLGAGEYELTINVIGETVRPPLVLAGEIPAELQVPILIPAGIGTKGNVEAAKAIVAYLMSPAFTPALEASHLARP